MLRSAFYLKKVVIICTTSAGANLAALTFKIYISRQKLVIICATLAAANLGMLEVKIRILRQK